MTQESKDWVREELAAQFHQIEELKSVIYVYQDGSQYEMIDVQNYIDNLKASGALVATRGYMTMKPVRWKKISPHEPLIPK